MSSFGGLMAEYPQIAIDRFQGEDVLRAKGYFLSHCHSDHMVGLSSVKFAERLRCNPHIRLYCSEVTIEFLRTDRRFKHLQPNLASLPIEQTTSISLINELNGQEENILVTLLPAGHCPGSVMFLFEGDEGTVLYTGDFRLAKGEAARLAPLHSGSRIKDITSVYLDTTFCVPEAMYIPSREESKDALLDLVERHISQSPQHIVRLSCKAKFGYEFLFVEMSRTFNQQVHVSANVMEQYERVPDLREHMTTDGRKTQIHACKYGSCPWDPSRVALTIQPSTMWFTSNARPEDVMRKVGHRYRLCFSFHSSFSEIRDFVRYIRPRHIYPNVIPYGSSEEEVKERLQDCLRLSTSNVRGDVCMNNKFKPLGKLKVVRRINRKRSHDSDDEDLFGASPEKQNKRTVKPFVSRSQEQGTEQRGLQEYQDGEEEDGETRAIQDGNISDTVYNAEGLEVCENAIDSSYSCTFADSDGILTDSESSDNDNDSSYKFGECSIKIANQDTVCNLKEQMSEDGNHCNGNTKNYERTGFTAGMSHCTSAARDAEASGMKNGSESAGDDDAGSGDGEALRPSQSSVNDGSIALFSDDSQGDSQRSGASLNSWFQYLPTQHPQPQTPTQIQPSHGSQRPVEEGDGAQRSTEGDVISPSPILISDDSSSEDGEDSDITNICSQHSLRSEGSSVIEVIKVEQLGTNKCHTGPLEEKGAGLQL